VGRCGKRAARREAAQRLAVEARGTPTIEPKIAARVGKRRAIGLDASLLPCLASAAGLLMAARACCRFEFTHIRRVVDGVRAAEHDV
jgi:hypothetical protein